MYRMLVLCSVLAGVAAAPVPAQDSVDQSRRNAIVQAIEKAAPAVVSINVVETRAEVPPMFRDFYEFFDLPSPRQRVEDRRIDSVGSGFIIDREGHILTNYHVLRRPAGLPP